MKRRNFLKSASISGLGFLAGAAVMNSRAFGGQQPPNIVMFLIDDLGWKDLGCYGSELFETPNIDRLAEQGMTFTDAYSACTVCSPTRAAVLTGKYPGRLNLTDWIPGHERNDRKLQVPDWIRYLEKRHTTIPEALKPLGYESYHLGKWHLGEGKSRWPEAYGFDVNVAGYSAGQPPSYFYPYKRTPDGPGIPTLSGGEPGEYLTDRLTDEAMQLIGQRDQKPFFLYLPYYAVHIPLEAKQDLVNKYKLKISPGMKQDNPVYAAMMETLDRNVGRILDQLESRGLAENTIVIFASDNGGLVHKYATDNSPLRRGKGTAYEGGVRVPLIIRWPGVTPAGTVCDEPVISTDFFPTIMEATGQVDWQERWRGIDGKSMVPLLKDPDARLDRKAIYWHYPHYHPGGATPYSALRAGDWKLIEYYEESEGPELYNLKDDLRERKNLAGKRPEKLTELQQLLGDWRSDVVAQEPIPNPNK